MDQMKYPVGCGENKLKNEMRQYIKTMFKSLNQGKLPEILKNAMEVFLYI